MNRYLYVMLGITAFVYGENTIEKNWSHYDTLTSKSYNYLRESAEKFRSQPEKSTGYAEAWLKKAQKEKDWFQTTLAYRHLMFISEKALRDQYSDSVLIAALKSKDNGLIGSAS